MVRRSRPLRSDVVCTHPDELMMIMMMVVVVLLSLQLCV